MTRLGDATSVDAGRDTKDKIRIAARQLFSRKGFEQASLREIADEVGITKASLYYHYASKRDLLLAVVQPVFDDLREIVASLDGLTYSQASARDVLDRHLNSMLAHRVIGVMFVKDGVAIGTAIGDSYKELIALLTEVRDWLAGPDADAEDLLRAGAALEIVRTALVSQESVPTADEALIKAVLLDAASGVLYPSTRQRVFR